MICSEIKQLVKGTRWMNYNTWSETPEDFLICPMLYDAQAFLCEKFGWSPAPIEKHYYSESVNWEFKFRGILFSATTFRDAFKAQIEQAVKYYWTKHRSLA